MSMRKQYEEDDGDKVNARERMCTRLEEKGREMAGIEGINE